MHRPEFDGVDPMHLKIPEAFRGADMDWEDQEKPRSVEPFRQGIKFQNKIENYAILGLVASTVGAVGLAIKRVVETGDGLSLIHQSFFVFIPTSMVVGALVGGASFVLVNKGIETVKALRRRARVGPKV